MSYFKKLPVSLDVDWVLSTPHELIQTTDIGKIERYKYASWGDMSMEPTPLLMYSLTPEVEQKILGLLPDALKACETPRPFLMKMTRLSDKPNMLYPHVDRGRRVAINFYLVCNEETTQFYEADEEAKKLIPTENFCAKAGECWVLNVSKPHSVVMNGAADRVGISLSYRHTRYEELISFFQ